ncbi:unnamed protein product [Strongylus vulgaris]|uniref:Abnormal cell migration protein 18-like fibronectin type I domain-containing protein n=1 Tax=Strongylus vulgaris TaxID=40348 RepID=A0A3P7I3U8_STRVU|nr:unnamed protein product [Strongylus vulgaris]
MPYVIIDFRSQILEMRNILVLAICSLASACVYKNEKYKDGDTWVVRSTFVMKCKINPDGSWSTKVIGCRTGNGVVVQPGQVIAEGDTVCIADHYNENNYRMKKAI